MKQPVVKALLYTSHDNDDYRFKAKSVESTSAKYAYLTGTTGYNYRKYLQRRPRSKHIQAIIDKLRYYNVINNQNNIHKYEHKLTQIQKCKIPIYQSRPNINFDHKPALQSLVISTGLKSSDPELELEGLFFNWCRAFKQNTFDWEYYGAYHEDTSQPHFHLVIFESKEKMQRISKKDLSRVFNKTALKRFKEHLGAKTKNTSRPPILINNELLQKLHTKIQQIRSLKSARARNLLTIFLNLIGMVINKINLYDTKFRHLSYNHRDDLRLPRAIVTGVYKKYQKQPVDYLSEYAKITPDAINSSVGLIKMAYKTLKQNQLMKEMQLYLDVIKTIPFQNDLTQYRQSLFLAMKSLQVQQDLQRQDEPVFNPLATEQLKQAQIKENELKRLFQKHLIQPVNQTKQQHRVQLR